MTAQLGIAPGSVVLVVIDLAGGGTQQVVAGLARALRDTRTHVTIITNQTSDGRWGDLLATVDVIEIPGELQVNQSRGSPTMLNNFRWLLHGVYIIRRRVKSAPPGTPVLAFLPGTNVLTSLALLGFRAALVLCERNDMSRQPLSPPLRVARRLLYRRATVATANRPEDVPRLSALVHPAPVQLVLNPQPSNLDRARPSASRRILAAGRLTAHKRHRDILIAFSALADEFPEWTLRLLGDGPERSALETLVQELDLADRVEISGWLPDITKDLCQGAMLVHASEYEGVSNAVVEAMATGLPVIASEASAPWPFARANDAETFGFSVFPTGDVDTLTARLRQLMTAGDFRDRIGEKAHDAVEQFTADPLTAWLPVMKAALRRSAT